MATIKDSWHRIPLPSYLHGWDFLELVEGDDFDAPLLTGVALPRGPAIVYNRFHISAQQLDERDTAILWLAPTLHHLCHRLLEESLAHADGIGSFESAAWDRFRGILCRDAVMNWGSIIEGAKREGIEFLVDTLVISLLEESCFLDRLAWGRPLEIKGSRHPDGN